MPKAAGEGVEIDFVGQGYTGQRAEQAASTHRIALEAVKLHEARRGLVPQPPLPAVGQGFMGRASQPDSPGVAVASPD